MANFFVDAPFAFLVCSQITPDFGNFAAQPSSSTLQSFQYARKLSIVFDGQKRSFEPFCPVHFTFNFGVNRKVQIA
jgi:hypothetical protein